MFVISGSRLFHKIVVYLLHSVTNKVCHLNFCCIFFPYYLIWHWFINLYSFYTLTRNVSKSQLFFSNLNSDCFNVVDLEQVKKPFSFKNCSDLLWEKKKFRWLKRTFWNSRLKVENFQIFWDHYLEQFIQTAKGQKYVKQNAF